MSLIKTLLSGIILLFAAQSLAVSPENNSQTDHLNALEQDHQTMKALINNPDLFWIPLNTNDILSLGIDPNHIFWEHFRMTNNKSVILTFSQLEKEAERDISTVSKGTLYENIEQLKKDYQLIKVLVDNPDLFWKPFKTPSGEVVVLTFSQLEERLKTIAPNEEQDNLREDIATYIVEILKSVESAKFAQKNIKEKVLPAIALRIRKFEADLNKANSWRRQ